MIMKAQDNTCNSMESPRLNKLEEKALLEFKERLLKDFKRQILLIKLYGSRARGERHIYSDIDLLVVVKRKTKKLKERLLDLECDISERYGYKDHLSPMIISLSEYRWQRRREWPFIMTVEEDGIDLWKSPTLEEMVKTT